jgi:hypothetical protein
MQNDPLVSAAGSLSRAPLTIRFVDQAQATACARRLDGISSGPVHVDDDLWEVGIDGEKTQAVIARVLGAAREALDGQTTAFALVNLDGREYRLDGE